MSRKAGKTADIPMPVISHYRLFRKSGMQLIDLKALAACKTGIGIGIARYGDIVIKITSSLLTICPKMQIIMAPIEILEMLSGSQIFVRPCFFLWFRDL